MTTLKPGTKVIICEDTIDCSDAVLFLERLIGKTLEIVELTNEYNDETLPTYKCKYEDGSIVTVEGIEYFPFVDADLKIVNLKEELLRDSILEFIFCEPAPKYTNLTGENFKDFQLTEHFEGYSLSSIQKIVSEREYEFNAHLKAVGIKQEEKPEFENSSISIETTIRIDNVNRKDWKRLEDLLFENKIWYTDEYNEDGYIMIDCDDNIKPYSLLVESGVTTQEDADKIDKIKPANIVIVF